MSLFSPKLFHETLANSGVKFFTGVPDSLLKDFCYYINDCLPRENHIIAANEGSALALGLGHHLSTSGIPLIYLQNSGLGNLINPLLSLTDREVYSIPGILMIGWRGEPGVSDEPQHKKQGTIMLELLDVMDVPFEVLGSNLNENEVVSLLQTCVAKARTENRICALVIRKNFFEKYIAKKEDDVKYDLTRERAIELIASNCEDDDVIISTTGLPSRELYEYRRKNKQNHSRDFLVVGGMGHANQIALGVALGQPGCRVICIDGDGAIIMHMGSLTTIGTSNQKNLLHIVVNNGAHDSVGGQKTTAFDINLGEIAKSSGYRYVFSACNEKEVKKLLPNLKNLMGPVFF